MLDDGGFILYQSLAINLYLAKKQGGRSPATSAAGRGAARAMEPLGGE